MNGPLKNSMYALRPAFNLPENIDLPKNMYNLRKIQAVGEDGTNDVLQSIQDKSSDGEISVLEKRWDYVLEQLRDLKAQLAQIKNSVSSVPSIKSQPSSKPASNIPNQLQLLDGAVISANASSPPHSLLLVRHLYKHSINLNISCHAHSTLSAKTEDIAAFSKPSTVSNGAHKLNLFLIWKEGLLDTQLVVSPTEQPIFGEVNILRYLARLGLNELDYPETDDAQLQIDSILDTSHRLLHVRTAKEKIAISRHLNGKLGKNSYFGGNDINICDIAIWSAFKQINLEGNNDLSQNLAKWFARVNASLN